MSIDNDLDLQGLKKIGAIVAGALQLMIRRLEPGITTAELDTIGATYLEQYGARSAPQLAYNFPGATCISINEEVAHGIPGKRVVKAGDMVNIDVSAERNGYFADTGASTPVGPVPERYRRLCSTTRQALNDALGKARADKPLNVIGKAIEKRANRTGFGIITNLCGHGVGRSLHEAPGFIPSFYDRSDKRMLREGMVIAIEPFLTTGPPMVSEGEDGWTLKTLHGHVAAQYEHTIVITRNKPIIITQTA